MTRSQEPSDDSTFLAWSGLQPTDWRSAVWSAAEAVWATHPAYLALQQQLDALVNQARQQASTRLALDVESMAVAYWQEAIVVGALMGYGLARTYPRRLEDLDQWIRRAAVYADINHLPVTRATLGARQAELSPGEPTDPRSTPAEWARDQLADWHDGDTPPTEAPYA